MARQSLRSSATLDTWLGRLHVAGALLVVATKLVRLADVDLPVVAV